MEEESSAEQCNAKGNRVCLSRSSFEGPTGVATRWKLPFSAPQCTFVPTRLLLTMSRAFPPIYWLRGSTLYGGFDVPTEHAFVTMCSAFPPINSRKSNL